VDKRLITLRYWLEDTLALSICSLAPASADASFRRYFRVQTDTDSFIAMDAPPEKESLSEFIFINQLLIEQKVHAPTILAENQTDGFLLLEDLGSRPYLEELEDNADELYNDALSSLVLIQLGIKQQPNTLLPLYDRSALTQELDLFIVWYCQRHLNLRLTKQQQTTWINTVEFLVGFCLEQPQVWVHRDFHSRNLMITHLNSPGVIDFQDMVIGPISYDLASIFKDCYIEWPRDTQLKWLQNYYDRIISAAPGISLSFKQLVRWYDLTGLQRHLKVLGIFCRLNYRDAKNQYLLDLPLVEKYIIEVLTIYPELNDFKIVFKQITESR